MGNYRSPRCFCFFCECTHAPKGFTSCIFSCIPFPKKNVSLQVDVSARACINTDRKIGKRDISRSGVSFVRRPTSRPNVTQSATHSSAGTSPAPLLPSLPNVTQAATHLLAGTSPAPLLPSLPNVTQAFTSAGIAATSSVSGTAPEPSVSSSAGVAPVSSQLNSAPLPDAITTVASESAPEILPPESSQRPNAEQRWSPHFDFQAVHGQLRAVIYALFVNASGDNKPISAPAIIRLLFDRGLIIEHTSRANAPKQVGNQMVTLRNADLSQSAAHQRYAARVGSLLISKAKVMNGLERTGNGKSAAYRISAEFAGALGVKLFS